MVSNWIKKLLGIDQLERRLNKIESEKSDLETKVINAEQEKQHFSELTNRSLIAGELENETMNYLATLNINPTEKTKAIVLQEMNIAQIAKTYGFERYAPEITSGITSPVITIKDFRDNPQKYFHKISKGILSFPVSINMSPVNQLLYEMGSGYSTLCGTKVDLMLRLKNEDHTNSQARENLQEALKFSRLTDNPVGYINPIDFLHNFQGIVAYVNDCDATTESKVEVQNQLFLIKETLYSAMEIAGTSRIRDLSELLEYNSSEEPHLNKTSIQKYSNTDELRANIKASMLYEQYGTKHSDIEELLPIRSTDTFKKLASEITSKILANDKDRKGLTNSIDKPLSEYSIGEAVLLSCYFARNVITQYKTLDDNIKDLMMGKDSAKVSGKCTDYTGLALHYLREYLIPMQSDKFQNWSFGVSIDRIGDNYNHCYMKITHVNPDLSVDVYFADPTTLASSKISDLKNTQEIAEIVEGLNLPLQINRDAEDLLYAAKENMDNDLFFE